ncbi:MAG: hypothetical protein WKF92_13295 [Pyrinomonadaceae bacterium]
MMNKFFIFSISAFLSLSLSCGSASITNNNAALNQNTNSPANVAVSPTPIVEMIVTPPITENNSNAAPSKTLTTPTPAKSATANNQQSKPAVTPANIIPDAETLRRKLQKPSSNGNVTRDPNDGMMMKRSNTNGVQ